MAAAMWAARIDTAVVWESICGRPKGIGAVRLRPTHRVMADEDAEPVIFIALHRRSEISTDTNTHAARHTDEGGVQNGNANFRSRSLRRYDAEVDCEANANANADSDGDGELNAKRSRTRNETGRPATRTSHLKSTS